jgi:hypothetical protein
MVTVCYEAAVRHTSWCRVVMTALQATVIYVVSVTGVSFCTLRNVYVRLLLPYQRKYTRSLYNTKDSVKIEGMS